MIEYIHQMVEVSYLWEENQSLSTSVLRSVNILKHKHVGDITFTHTLYKDQTGKSRCLLDELLHLPDRERFTAAAEAKL